MDNYSDHIDISVHQLGSVASRMLDNTTTGYIAAVFKSSFYVESDAGFVCIGNEDFEPAPLNLITEAPAGTDWSASGLQCHDKVNVFTHTIKVGNRFFFRLSNATKWSPDPISEHWTANDLKHGLRSFREASAGHVPADGLGQFLFSECGPFNDQPVCRAAEKPIAQLQGWLKAKLRNPRNRVEPSWASIQSLIGLGPGLTPSGDDFVGGMMLALHSLNEPNICIELWANVKGYAAQASNPISFAHLNTASEGKGRASIHQAISAMLDRCPGSILKSIPCINRIGHTSGWDTMAGVIVALDIWQQAQDIKIN
jgi:hypothetical protein